MSLHLPLPIPHNRAKESKILHDPIPLHAHSKPKGLENPVCRIWGTRHLPHEGHAVQESLPRTRKVEGKHGDDESEAETVVSVRAQRIEMALLLRSQVNH